MQELCDVLWRCSQHALLLQILDAPLWFLVEPLTQVSAPTFQNKATDSAVMNDFLRIPVELDFFSAFVFARNKIPVGVLI